MGKVKRADTGTGGLSYFMLEEKKGGRGDGKEIVTSTSESDGFWQCNLVTPKENNWV